MPLAQTSVRSHRRGVSAVGLSVLMLLVLASPMVHPSTLSSETAARSTYYTPQGQAQGVNTTSTGVLTVPYNRTFSGEQIEEASAMAGEAGETRAGEQPAAPAAEAERSTRRSSQESAARSSRRARFERADNTDSAGDG